MAKWQNVNWQMANGKNDGHIDILFSRVDITTGHHNQNTKCFSQCVLFLGTRKQWG